MKVRSFSNYLLIWRREIAVSDELCPNSRLILIFLENMCWNVTLADILEIILSYLFT